MNHVQSIPVADLRTAEILQSARQVFSEKGFDGASMQDLARTAGMSVGNFYRYFPSKAAIVSALIEHDLEEMHRDFAAILEEQDTLGALRRKIAERVAEAKCDSEGRLWAEITAAALRKPEIGEVSIKMEEAIVENLIRVFSHMTRVPTDDARRLWSSSARLIVMLVKSCAMQRPDVPDARHLENLVLRTIDRTLDDITSSAVKGF